MTPARLDEILAHASKKRILVIGDLMLDEFVWGKVGRISPEAPVPVVEVTSETSYPGGAANVARNLREFVEHTAVIGLIGTDRGGRELRELLEKGRIATDGIVEDADFRTIVKTRIVARQQQVVRVDREELRPPTDAQIALVTKRIREQISEVDAVIFEDYGKGFLSPDLVKEVAAFALIAGKIVTADPNPRHALPWKNVTAVKPNRSEAFLAAGIPWSDSVDPVEKDEALLRVGRVLLDIWDTKYLLITLGEQGMMLFERNGTRYHTPTRAQQVFDVSGAGDTAIALFTLALCCEATAREAADIANHASAVVVGKLGTATVTRAELIASVHDGFSAYELSPAVFVDRDGTIMRDVNYCARPEDVEIFVGVPEALRRLKQAGFKIIVITNQSGIGRGYFRETDYRAVELEVERQIGVGVIDASYFCPDVPDSGSTRRKPEPEMVFEAQRDHALDLARSFFVGDKAIDADCGRNAGVRTIVVQTGDEQHEMSNADWIVRDFAAATEIILRHGV